MKIIDNKKDYYDYLMGVYGQDPLVIYDRRNSFIITPGDPSCKIGTIFGLHESSNHKLWLDYTGVTKWEDRCLYLLIEIGFTQIIICMKPINNQPILNIISEKIVSNKLGKGVVSVFKITKDWKSNISIGSELTIPGCNYIWSNTWLPRIISPDTMWNGIYNYLSSQKDKPIIDTRTDIQKLESHGFDKKESFRKIK